MNQKNKKNRECSTNSPKYVLLQLLQHIKTIIKGAKSDMARIFHAWPDGIFTEIKQNFRGKNFQSKLEFYPR